MLTRSGMKAKYERLYANGIMYLAKDEPELAIKYFEGAAMQLKEYVQGLCDEEQDEMRDWLLEMVAHVRELEKYMQELTSDMVEMIQDSSPEEKQYLEKKISALASKIGQMK